MSQVDAFAALLASDPTVAPELKDAMQINESGRQGVPARQHPNILSEPSGSRAPEHNSAGIESGPLSPEQKRLADDDSDFWCAYDEDGTYGAEE